MSLLYKHQDDVIDPDCPYCKANLTIAIEKKNNEFEEKTL
jgi:hypothetical protein